MTYAIPGHTADFIHVLLFNTQFNQKKFTIIRQFREIVQLHDDLISSMFVETGTSDFLWEM